MENPFKCGYRMQQNTKKMKKVFWILVLVGITLFILGNSLMDYEASHSSSGAVTQILTPQNQGEVDESLEFLIRKFAHLFEYALLGIGIVAVAMQTPKCSVFWFPCFYVLAIGVIDEFIQSFTNRSSAVSDVLLDFLGGMLGMGLFWLGFQLKQRLITRLKTK